MIEGRRVFITGGAGFIGSATAERLLEFNYVTIFDNLHRGQFNDRLASHPQIQVIQGDILDTSALASAIDGHDIIIHCAAIAGIECALSREDGAARFELPPDRVEDVLAVATHDTVIGTTPERHDLSGLDVPLRSHGGLSEQRVPFLLNCPTLDLPADQLIRNYDIFEIALNHTQ